MEKPINLIGIYYRAETNRKWIKTPADLIRKNW